MNSTIERIELFRADYPVRGRFKFFPSARDKPPVRQTVVVKIVAADGTTGWGQSVPSPRWSYETIETVESTLRHYLAPLLIGRDASDADGIRREMDRAIAPSFATGQPICKAGIDLALFDLAGKLLSKSAAERWDRQSGGRPQLAASDTVAGDAASVPADAGSVGNGRKSDLQSDAVTLSWTLNPARPEDVEAEVAEAHQRGYRHFNIKVAPDAALDVELCRRVRALAPDARLWADANGGYDLETALAAAPRLADLGLMALEQPLPAVQLSGFARLRRQGAIPILMDEPLVTCDVLREFHQLGLLDGAAIKVSRCGGLHEARRQVEYLLDNGLLFFGSGLTDPDVSLAASLLLFGAYGLSTPAALNGPQYLQGSILKTPLVAHGDAIAVPRGVGLGVDVDEDRLSLSPES